MSTLEAMFVSFVHQLYQQHSDAAGLLRLRSSHIQRRLRSIEAIQGACWTAPCSPALPAGTESSCGQSDASPSREECQARVQSWHASLHNLVHNPLIVPADSMRATNSVLASRASTSPLSSPRSISSLSPFTRISPTTSWSGLHIESSNIPDDVAASGSSAGSSDKHHRSGPEAELSSSHPIPSPTLDNDRLHPVSMRAHDPAIHSSELTAQGTILVDKHNNNAAPLVDGLHDSCDRGLKRPLPKSPAIDHRPASLHPWREISRSKDSDEDSTWTRKRLRSDCAGAGENHISHLAKAQTSSVRSRKVSTMPKTSTGPKPLFALINQIGQRDKAADVQATVQVLKERLARPYTSPRSLDGSIPMHLDTPLAAIIHALPNLAGDIEDSAIDEQLSRLLNRLALAAFHCAYRAAQAKPGEFLEEVARNHLQPADQLRARNGTRRAKVKERFTELVFCQSKGKRDWRKESVHVSNWQSWGRPWFELTDRFGRGIPLLVPGEMTNHR